MVVGWPADTAKVMRHLRAPVRWRLSETLRPWRPAGSPAEVRFHLAAVLGAIGAFDSTSRELAEALKLDPALEKREEVKQLRARLKG